MSPCPGLPCLLALCLLALASPIFAGGIGGKVTNPEKCLGVCALQRDAENPQKPKEFAGSFNRQTGEFRIENLPAGTYDLRVRIAGGQLDGADMRALNPDGAGPLTEADEKAIREVIANLPPSFMDTNRPIFIRGNGSRAKVLVEQIRCRRFHSGKPGEIIWRVEVWPFEQRTGAWVKSQAFPQILCRLRAPGDVGLDAFAKLTWLFDPQFGGIELGATDEVKGVSVIILEPTATCGKAPGTVETQIEQYRKAHPTEE